MEPTLRQSRSFNSDNSPPPLEDAMVLTNFLKFRGKTARFQPLPLEFKLPTGRNRRTCGHAKELMVVDGAGRPVPKTFA